MQESPPPPSLSYKRLSYFITETIIPGVGDHPIMTVATLKPRESTNNETMTCGTANPAIITAPMLKVIGLSQTSIDTD